MIQRSNVFSQHACWGFVCRHSNWFCCINYFTIYVFGSFIKQKETAEMIICSTYDELEFYCKLNNVIDVW